jgi:acyl-CoA reductase-like NAD-dependent aldehyde dehydrogenase
MTGTLTTVSPIDGSVVVERAYAGSLEIQRDLRRAEKAAPGWRATPVEERAALLLRALDLMVARKADLALEITRQMGRPIAHSPLEIGGLEERWRYMAEAAPEALADLDVGPKQGFRRFIRREPLGVVFVVAPWNYPYLTAVNAVVPALVAGNVVILKHSVQTPLTAERFQEALDAAGLPTGVFQHLHLAHDDVAKVVASPLVRLVSFTGSVPGGRAMAAAAVNTLAATNLELGGKDPAYVRHDADLAHAIDGIVDGACFNAGQSCCAIERVYVHERFYDDFVAGAAALMRRYVLGDPTDPATTLGPLVRASAADFVRGQIEEAVAAGATAHIDPGGFERDRPGSPYLAPQLLTGVDHTMRVMFEETFGPAIGVVKVASDEEAVALINDSRYGLTAAVWTGDDEAAVDIGHRLETGTVLMNRCDYLDPALAWTGVKDSGRGVSLSRLAFEHLTRPKSFHLRLGTS